MCIYGSGRVKSMSMVKTNPPCKKKGPEGDELKENETPAWWWPKGEKNVKKKC